MKTLHLVVDRKHFERIITEKRTDYRKIKPFYTQRLENKRYDSVSFRNGYRTNAPRVVYKFKGFKEWNGYYQLFLGDLVKINDEGQAIVDLKVTEMLQKSVNEIS